MPTLIGSNTRYRSLVSSRKKGHQFAPGPNRTNSRPPSRTAKIALVVTVAATAAAVEAAQAPTRNFLHHKVPRQHEVKHKDAATPTAQIQGHGHRQGLGLRGRGNMETPCQRSQAFNTNDFNWKCVRTCARGN